MTELDREAFKKAAVSVYRNELSFRLAANEEKYEKLATQRIYEIWQKAIDWHIAQGEGNE